MRKSAAILAAVLVLVMLFTGCDQSVGNPSESESAGASGAQSTSEEPVPESSVIVPEAPEEEEIAVAVAQTGNDAKIQEAQQGGAVKVGLSVPSLEDAYYAQVRDGVQSQCDQYGYELSVADAGGSAEQQAKDLAAFASQNVTAVIASPINQAALEDATSQLNQAGIILVSFGTQSQDLDAPQFSGKQVPNANAVYVMREYDYGTAIGNSAVNWIQSRLNDMGNVLILTDDANLQSYTRANGIMDAIMSTSMDSFIVGRETAVDRESGKKVTTEALAAMPEINVIVATTDAAALGAQDAVREANLPQESIDVFYIGGGGGSTDAMADMQAEGSLIRATANLDPNSVGVNCVNSIHSIIEGGTMPIKDQVMIAYWTPAAVTQESANTPQAPADTSGEAQPEGEAAGAEEAPPAEEGQPAAEAPQGESESAEPAPDAEPAQSTTPRINPGA